MMLGQIIYMSITIPSVILSGLYFSTCNDVYNAFALIFAIISAGCACVQWIPQIYKTFQLKAAGNLSIIG